MTGLEAKNRTVRLGIMVSSEFISAGPAPSGIKVPVREARGSKRSVRDSMEDGE